MRTVVFCKPVCCVFDVDLLCVSFLVRIPEDALPYWAALRGPDGGVVDLQADVCSNFLRKPTLQPTKRTLLRRQCNNAASATEMQGGDTPDREGDRSSAWLLPWCVMQRPTENRTCQSTPATISATVTREVLCLPLPAAKPQDCWRRGVGRLQWRFVQGWSPIAAKHNAPR